MSNTSSQQPHTIFLINELLESILLHTDMRTLMTSGQRVCRGWNETIKSSPRLQEHLFLKPSKQPSEKCQRTRNPLLEDILWAQFFLKQQQNPDSTAEVSRFPLRECDRVRLKAYLRKDASWKQMLLQQPPTSSIGVLEIIRRSDSEFTKLAVSPDSEFLRMGHILKLLHGRSTLVPTRNKWILWSGRSRIKMPLNFELWAPKWVYEPGTLQSVQEWVPDNIDWDSLRLEVASMYLNDFDCDLVIVSERRQKLFQGEDRVHRESKLDRWLERVFGECRVEIGRKHINHSWIPIKGVGVDRRWVLRPCSATPLVPTLSASDASDSSSFSSSFSSSV